MSQVVPITIEAARSLYAVEDAAHDFDHVLRVLSLAVRISQAESADTAVVETATLLHDVAHGQPQHHLRGAERAREILAACPSDFVESVTHAIAAHRFRAEPNPRTLEAQVLYDADKLDAIGAVGIARAFAHGASLGQRLFVALRDVDPEMCTQGTQHTTVHEFVFKLSRLRDLLYTQTAREIARGRHEFMVQVFRQLDAELCGDA